MRKRKDNSYLSRLTSKFKLRKAEANKVNYSEISRFEKIEQALRRSRQEFIGLFRNSLEALAYTDMDNIILEINKRLEILSGYKLEELRGSAY
jgi:PAS domain-containing protein